MTLSVVASYLLQQIPPYKKSGRALKWVLGLHFLILLYLIPGRFNSQKVISPAPKVAIRTIKLQPQKAKSRKQATHTSGKTSKKEKPQTKKEKDRAIAALENLDQLQTIDAIEDQVSTLTIDRTTPINLDASYDQELSFYLRKWLKLPEYGSVKVEVKISREGKVLNLEILSSESEINSSWVKEHLGTMNLPSFHQSYKGLSEKSFVLVLSNE